MGTEKGERADRMFLSFIVHIVAKRRLSLLCKCFQILPCFYSILMLRCVVLETYSHFHDLLFTISSHFVFSMHEFVIRCLICNCNVLCCCSFFPLFFRLLFLPLALSLIFIFPGLFLGGGEL